MRDTVDYEYNLRSIMNDVPDHEATMRYTGMWYGKIYRVRVARKFLSRLVYLNAIVVYLG